jgi:eukaryotic translation initiation factor 2C
MIAVPGRILNGPDVHYANKKITPNDGSWNLAMVNFVQKTALTKWAYLRIYWGNPRQGHESPDPVFRGNFLTEQIDQFQDSLRKVGVTADRCMGGQTIVANPMDPASTERQIDNAIQGFRKNPPKLILAVLPANDNTAIYNRVKRACDIREGFLNVCVIDEKFAGSKIQYHANVALKFNLKLGGRNHRLDAPQMGLIKDKKTMVVGIDVTHPSPGSSSKAPSVAGIVASVDETLGQWPADIRIQESRKEMVAPLESMFESRLRLWQKHNNKALPDNILIYRDGVSEGQYSEVLAHELPLIRAACRKTYSAPATKAGLPKLAIIIVGKRHHTRFYVPDSQAATAADRNGNPRSGTVVERGVTEARHWDFFLQAHAALQGTARPAHYFVLYDDVFRARGPAAAADALLALTHHLCYLYGRATKAVSICPPAYYADLVCERARAYLSGWFEEPTPVASPQGSAAGSEAARSEAPGADTVLVHERVRDTMFYV